MEEWPENPVQRGASPAAQSLVPTWDVRRPQPCQRGSRGGGGRDRLPRAATATRRSILIYLFILWPLLEQKALCFCPLREHLPS